MSAHREAADWVVTGLDGVMRQLHGQVQALMTHDTDEQARNGFYAPSSVPYTAIVGRDGHLVDTLSGWSDKRLDWLVDRANAALQVEPRSR